MTKKVEKRVMHGGFNTSLLLSAMKVVRTYSLKSKEVRLKKGAKIVKHS